MSNPLQRVQDLIRLANSAESDTNHEARAAALQACRLIAKHGFVVSEPAPPTTQKPPSSVEAVGRAVREVATDIASRVTAEDVVDVVSVLIKRGRGR